MQSYKTVIQFICHEAEGFDMTQAYKYFKERIQSNNTDVNKYSDDEIISFCKFYDAAIEVHRLFNNNKSIWLVQHVISSYNILDNGGYKIEDNNCNVSVDWYMNFIKHYSKIFNVDIKDIKIRSYSWDSDDEYGERDELRFFIL